MRELPTWAAEAVALYESNACSQFILHGNVDDRLVLPLEPRPELGSLVDFLLRVLLPRFDVVLSYDLGNGVRVEKGGEIFTQWPAFPQNQDLPRQPRTAVETLTHYFRYVANLARLGRGRVQVACFIKAAHLLAPNLAGGLSYDLNALALLIREWGCDELLTRHSLATFLITENLHDLHPLLVNNPRAAAVKVPLPAATDLRTAVELLAPTVRQAFQPDSPGQPGKADVRQAFQPDSPGQPGKADVRQAFQPDSPGQPGKADVRQAFQPDSPGQPGKADVLPDFPVEQLTGVTLSSLEALLKKLTYRGRLPAGADLANLKKDLVEKDCGGLIEFVRPRRTLDNYHGQEAVKVWLRQDVALWRQNDLAALPMGYLLCGPVGTGKTFLVECLAGEAEAPVVKLKNFRDRWIGSTEGNLEKIFRLLHALGRCIVFIDEADQALGRRAGGDGDAGVGGRVYSMIAEEMGNPANRGRILWVLASSRPDLIEVDLKRPGRIDVKVPLFPTTTTQESWELLTALCRRQGVDVSADLGAALEPLAPLWLTPGAAESLAVKVYRRVRARGQTPAEALRACLTDYQHPVAREVLDFQIRLAVEEASDIDFVPLAFRSRKVER